MKLFMPDFETTGLVKSSHDFLNQPGIVQVAALILDVRGDELVEEEVLNTLVNPEIAVWQEDAIKTHGINREMVRESPTFFQVFEDMAKMAQKCDTWAGYNIKFDRDVLWYQLLRYGFERNFPWPRHELDVMKRVREKLEMQGKRGEKNVTLGEAYERIVGKKLHEAHDALADIRATADVLRRLKDYDPNVNIR